MLKYIDEVREKLLWKEIDDIEKRFENNPRECFLQMHEKFKNFLPLIKDVSTPFKFDELVSCLERYQDCIKKINQPDQQIFDCIKEFNEIGQDIHGKQNGWGADLIDDVVEKNPKLLNQAIEFYKADRNNDSDCYLIKIAEKNPETKKDIVDFLHENVSYTKENHESSSSYNDYNIALKLYSLSGDEKDLQDAREQLSQYLKKKKESNSGSVSALYPIILDNFKSLPDEEAKKVLSKEVFDVAEDTLFMSPKNGADYCHFHNVIGLCAYYGADIVSESISTLKRETRNLPGTRRQKGIMYSNLDLQSETFFEALDCIVQKEPSRAKEAFEMGKDFNRALGFDEKFTCYDSKFYYYHALGTFAKADESLKPEIISIIKENMVQDKEKDPEGYDFKAGKKVMQELTMPQVGISNTRVD